MPTIDSYPGAVDHAAELTTLRMENHRLHELVRKADERYVTQGRELAHLKSAFRIVCDKALFWIGMRVPSLDTFAEVDTDDIRSLRSEHAYPTAETGER